MTNVEIAHVFQTIADLLAIRQENAFRIRAYERAAMTVQGLPQDVGELYRTGGRDALRAIPGIGEDLADKLIELITRGRLAFLTTLQRAVPKGLLMVMAVEGMGPKRTAYAWKEFGVRTLRDFERLCKSGKLTKRRGWGPQSVANILRAIAMLRKFGERLPLGVALPLAESLAHALEQSGFCERVAIAGSIRRRKETIGDIDLLATSAHPQRTIEYFCASSSVARVIAHGPTKANVLLRSGIEADLRVLAPEAFGAGLYYFTGSKLHNVRTRTMAVRKHLTVNEYGVFRGTKAHKGKRVACRTEEDVFRAIGLPYIPPELREDTGEIEAALAGKLPHLVEERDLRGDLHLHTNFSDGSDTLPTMIAAAKRAGLSYIAVTDHASPLGMVRGIKAGNIGAYVRRVRAAAAKVGGIHVLAGAEVDILPDGSLYLPDAALKQLDWVVGSIHQAFRQTEAKATARLLRAMENPYLSCVGHPTTRMIGEREGMRFDWDTVFRAARARGIAFELNASWQRLDLDDVRCRQAKAAGVRIVINSDAHAATGISFRYGVSQARRGWIERTDVLNALPWEAFRRRVRRGA